MCPTLFSLGSIAIQSEILFSFLLELRRGKECGGWVEKKKDLIPRKCSTNLPARCLEKPLAHHPSTWLNSPGSVSSFCSSSASRELALLFFFFLLLIFFFPFHLTSIRRCVRATTHFCRRADLAGLSFGSLLPSLHHSCFLPKLRVKGENKKLKEKNRKAFGGEEKA